MILTPSKTIKSKICVVCEDRFETPHFNTICCSDDCKNKRRRQLQNMKNKINPPKSAYKKKKETTRICVICEKEFMTAHYSKKTCRPKCARELQDQTAKAIQNKMKKRTEDGVRGGEIKVGEIPSWALSRGRIHYQGLTI